MVLNLFTKIFPVSQQLPVLLQLSIMFSNSLCDSLPCPMQLIKCLHQQLNFSHVAGSIWDWPYVSPSEFNLAKHVNSK